MIIQKVDPAREAFSDYSLEGAVLTIGGIAVDLETAQEDQEVIIPFSNHNGKIHQGMMPCCTYVAEVVIPPRRYEIMEAIRHPIKVSSGEENGDEVLAAHTETTPVPIDVDSVVLKLWPAEHDRHEEIGMAGGEENAE
jgi:hypothetical protein